MTELLRGETRQLMPRQSRRGLPTRDEGPGHRTIPLFTRHVCPFQSFL